MPLKILHVAAMPFPSIQGTQVYIEDLCSKQTESGKEVHLLTYHHGIKRHTPYSFFLHKLGDFPPYRSLKSGPSIEKIILDMRMVLAIRSLVRAIRPDIIHAHHYESLFASLIACKGKVPVVYHAHTLLEYELPYYFNFNVMKILSKIAGRFTDAFLPANADVCIAISPFIVSYLIGRGIETEKVFYVPPAIDPPMVNALVKSRGDLIPSWDFVYAGNLDSYQGLDVVLKGFSLLVRKHKRKVNFLVISDSDSAQFFRMAEKFSVRSFIHFEKHGSPESVFSRLRECRIALTPRKIPGGVPIKLLNYLHARLPVLASVHGCAGLVHEKEVMIFDSEEGFCYCALRLLKDEELRKNLSINGYNALKEKFSWEKSLEVLDSAYKIIF